MKTKYLLVGRSGSGKDTLTNYLCNELGLKQVLSYTTRPRRHINEDTHRFISVADSFNMQRTEDIIAYTKIGEYEYFATYEQLMESDIYIIDPNGIDYFKNKYADKLEQDNIHVITIYIHTDDDLRVSRAMLRNDDIRVYNKRCIDEYDQFNKFEDEVGYDWEVCNNDGEEAKIQIEVIVNYYNDNK